MDKPPQPSTDPPTRRPAQGRPEQRRGATGSGSTRPFDRLRVAPSGVEGRAESRAEGIVRELLPSQLVKVELDGRHEVIAHLGDPVRRNFVRVLVGDRVRVVLMAHDPKRARVVEKV